MDVLQTKLLIIYASIDGHTAKICHFMKEALESSGYSVFLKSIKDWQGSFEDFDKVVFASNIRYGKHDIVIESLINKNYKHLNQIKSAFVSVNLVARKKDKCNAWNNPYVLKFLSSTKWKPDIVEVFGGKLDYRLYSFKDSFMIRLIMLITKGPLRTKTEVVYTDWDKVRSFTDDLIKL